MKRWRNLTFVSAALVIVNIAVFFVSSLPGKQLLSLGDLNLYSVMADREYYRVLTAMFLHADMQHLFNNMLILFFLGNMIEEKVGHVWYGFFFFLSGIGGNLASLWLKFRTNDPVGSIGASGVVFGLDGVLLALVLFSGSRMEHVTAKRVVLMIFLSLYSGYTGHNIDNAAHMGGLITGFVLGSIYCLITGDTFRHNRSQDNAMWR